MAYIVKVDGEIFRVPAELLREISDSINGKEINYDEVKNMARRGRIDDAGLSFDEALIF